MVTLTPNCCGHPLDEHRPNIGCTHGWMPIYVDGVVVGLQDFGCLCMFAATQQFVDSTASACQNTWANRART